MAKLAFTPDGKLAVSIDNGELETRLAVYRVSETGEFKEVKDRLGWPCITR